MSKTNSKIYTIFAGPNGAGKTTLYQQIVAEFPHKELGVRINIDEIIKERFAHDWKQTNTQLSAGKIAVNMIRDCLKLGRSFNQETTLTGKSILSNMEKAKENGFEIHLFYVGLESAQISINRVSARTLRGGHGIPKEDLLRRYKASLGNLQTVLPLCNKVVVYDNSANDSSKSFAGKPLLTVCNNKIVSLDNDMPLYLKEILHKYIESFGKKQ